MRKLFIPSLGFLASCSSVPHLDNLPEKVSPAIVSADVGDTFQLDPMIPNTEIGSLVTKIAEKHEIPVLAFHRLIRKESNYNQYAKGKQDEIGLGQIKFQTARYVGYQGSVIGLFDAETNLEYSALYFKKMTGSKYYDCLSLSRYQNPSTKICTAYGRSIMSPP